MTPTPTPTRPTQVSLFDKAKGFLAKDDLRRQIAVALPKHLTPDRMLRVALTSVMSSPKLQECFNTVVGQASIAKSLLTASQLGLEVDGRGGHLVPFRDNKANAMLAQFIPGYQGLIGLAYNHPMVKAIWAEAVYENDVFVEKKGSERILIHEPYSGDGEPGDIKAAYAVCQMDNGAKTWCVLRAREITKIKKSSKSASSDYSPWVTNEESMWKKSAIRQLCKFIPQANELRNAMEVDDVNDGNVENDRFESSKPVFANVTTLVDTSAPAVGSDDDVPMDYPAKPAAIVAQPPAIVNVAASAITPRGELEAILSFGGFTFDQLKTVIVDLGFVPDMDSFGSIDEIPIAGVRKIVAAKIGLLNQLTTLFPKP